MKFDFVAKHRGTWPVGMLCDVLGVSASGFYARIVRPERARARADAALAVALHRRFLMSDRTYGARRLWRDVRAEGFTVGLHQVKRVMRAQGLRARPRRRAVPTDPGVRSPHAIAPNVLNRDFTATAPNQKWVAGFTYLWTHGGSSMSPSCSISTRGARSAGPCRRR